MSRATVRKRHLLTYTTVCEGSRNTVIAYYLTPRQLARRWDGVSPVRMPFAKLTANAMSAVHRRGVLPAAVKEMRLSTQRFPDGSWYYYWTVAVAHQGDEYRSEPTEVLLDLFGEVIEQEEKVFDEPNYKKRNAASDAYTESLPPVG